MSEHGAIYVERDKCPVYTAIRVIEGRWKPMIVRRLGDRALGFGELRRTMPGVTIKVLRQHLRQLEAEGVVTRSVKPRPTLSVRYQLTPHGCTLGPVFETLWAWGVFHLAFLEDARAKLTKSSRSNGKAACAL
jgi:DNA-binding HxlR family transcriptional regulator